MRILHKSKRAVAPPSQVAELIARLLNTPNDDLSQVLSDIEAWKWPRSDLNAWIKVLNKFDAILEEIIRDYEVDKLQVNVFTPATKATLCEILRFERLLLENSTNRKMFNSYDRLNSLLFTPDLDVLILSLNLLLRPSQQYSAQPSVSHALNISTPRLQSLAKRWPHLREYGVSLVDLASPQGTAVVDALPADARQVHFSFYRTDESTPENKMDTDAEPSQSSPRKTHATAASSAVSIHVDSAALQTKSDVDILADIIDKYAVPEAEKFELMCRTRAATVLNQGNEAQREKLVVVRLLAIAIFSHTHPETQATSSLFLYEPDLINHIAELLQIDKGVTVPVQTAAVAALDALAHYRNRIQEVLTSVNAGVNHGILMALIRKTVADVANPDSTLPHSFAEALLSFVTFIASHASGGNMVVGAGLIPLLIQVIENKLPHRLPLVSKTMQLVDNVLYSFTNAFQLFCTSRGVDALVERIEFEIDLDLKEFGHEQRSREIYGAHGDLPVARAAILKHVLRSLHRMMQSSGTSEGLRGLIDTSILKSIKKIIKYRGLFGPTVVPLAINIMATFVHNEPTSLAIIQEAGLPEAFYTAIEAGLEPAIEVIQAIPNAIGALCLNEAGTAQLASHPSVIPAIFSIFTSDRHLKVLLDKENASTLSKIEVLGNAYAVPAELQQWYKLVGVTPSASGVEGDVPMEDDAPAKSHDNNIVSFIDIFLRASFFASIFLEGLFQHTPHCKDFITATDGLARLGRLTSLPCIPYDFANSVASDSMVQVMRTMSELSHLSKLVKESLDETKGFWESIDENSKLLPLVDIAADQEMAANQTFRNLVTLHIRVTLLSDVFATAGYAHGRAAIGLLQTFMNSTTPDVVKNLGSLHRVAIWENIILKAGLVTKGIDIPATPISSPLEATPEQTSIPLPDGEVQVTIQNGEAGATVPVAATVPQDSSLHHNATAIKHLTHGIPSSLAPFFQAMVKMFHARRNPDAAQKKQITESSSVIAEIMVKHLSLTDFKDKASVYSYHTIMLGLITILLIDERTANSTLHTVQASALYQMGGLDAIFGVTQSFMSTIDSIVILPAEVRSEIQKQELANAYRGLKVALHLIHPLISAKPLLESGQTLLMVTRDKKDTDPGYFEPHNFLIKLRFAALPTVLELTNGEGEEAKSDPTIEGAAPGIPRALGPDENRIRQLTDMGFPRSAAERALARTQNNLNAATDLLLSHPFPLPPDPVPGPDQADAGDAGDAGQEDQANSGEEPIAVDATSDDSTATPVPETQEVPVEVVPGKSTEEWRKELDEAREQLRSNISRQALLLVDEHLSLIFHLHVAFIRPNNSHQQKAVRDLVDDIKDFSPFAYDVQEQPLANRCRLLALVLCETPSSLTPELRVTLMDSLLALLLSNPVSIDPEHPSIPRWLAAHLLVTEALFTLAEEPRSITLPKEGEPIVAQDIATGPSLTDAKTIVFDFCLRLLAIPDLPNDELLSTLRLFVLLTRDHDTASQFVKRDGLSMLFRRLKASAVPGSSSYIATILRHSVEDAATVQSIMKQAIKRYFTQPRSNVVETTTFVRNCSAMALRDSRAFIQVTESMCQLVAPFSSSYHLKLRDPLVVGEKPVEPAVELSTQMQVDPSSAAVQPPAESFESVVHFLVAELMRSTKPDATPAAEGTTSEVVPPASLPATSVPAGGETTPPIDSAAKDRYQYSCFLMQCLTELLFSYDSCKTAFLSYSSKKRSTVSSKEIQNKFRTATLNFLLSDLISFETINPQPNSSSRDRITMCNWAMSLLVALCVDTSSSHELKEVSPDLVSVRKFVLEAVSRAIKDLPSSDSVEARYGRLLALADLCHRLLTVRFNSSSRKHQDDTPTHIAKVMLEKNFVATLTTALSEVDLNYPNVRGLVASILRPLEYLTKIAIKMSRTSNKTKDAAEGQRVESESSIASDDDEDDDDDDEEMQADPREETPDLYRNSALGMFGGEMEDVHFGAEDEMDEDDDDEDDDADMEFGEETGSEDTSNTGDDGEDDLEDPAHQPGDEDLVEHDDEDDEDEDGDDGEEQMNGPEGDEGDEEMIELPVPEQYLGPIQIVHAEQEDEPEMLSEDEWFWIPGAFLRRTSLGLETHSLPLVDDNVQLFGRGRNGPVPAPEATTHPLLLDASANRVPAVQPRNSRQPQRIVTGGSADLLQTLEDLIGGGAVQLFQHVMTRRGGGAPETIRLDVPAAALGGFLQQRRGPGGLSAAVRVVERPPRPNSTQAQGRDLDPLLTLQRWAEEIKILHGDFVTERVGKLANHITLALLPAAIESAKEAKIREEKEEALRLEAEAKAEAEAAAAAEAEAEAKKKTEVEAEATPADVSEEPKQVPEQEGVTVTPQDTDADMNDVSTEPPVEIPADVAADAAEAEVPEAGPSAPAAPAQPLPDDMREEVLNQHVRDQRASRVERPPDSQISSEFLDALPPEIRAEIIQQEAIERARRRADAATTNAPAGAPAEIDPASFIATLDPGLRQAAGAYREGRGPRRQLNTRPRTIPGASGSSAPRKFVPQHDAIQLLDKQGVAVLVRLLFFPQVLRKTLLFKVLVNLCENAKTRTELFNLLLNILQDGTGDLGAVDKGFAQMSRASDYFTALALPNLQEEVVPDLIAQRCLEALTYIVSANELSSLFFLTEHELPAGLRRSSESLLKTPSIMESVVGLLATVTRPLASAKDKKPDPQPAPAPPSLLRPIPAVPPETPAESTPAAPPAAEPADATSSTVPAPASKDLSIEAVEERLLLAAPPQIPHPVLRLIVNILTVGECSSRTFQQSLALIQHLSYIPDARDVVAQELKSKAQEFGLGLYSDLDDLASNLRESTGDIVVGSVASKFSPASSVQAKLLRVLKTIDYMYSPKSLASLGGSGESDADKVQDIYESFRFTPLWKRLGDCLAIVEEKPDTEHIATVLLPLIEALMVVCKYVGSKTSSAARLLRATSSPRSPTTPRESMEDLFVTFTDAHRKVLNLMVRNNPSLMSGSFSLLVNNPRVLDFDNKRNYFTQQLHRRPHAREHHGTLQLNVRRARVFEDSFQHLQRKTGDQIKHGKLSVRFYDEEGVDAGGVTREWFQILARQMFDPNNALFQPCAADRLTYQPNKNSWVNPEHLSFFKFVGRVIGKAIYDGRLLDAYFARSLYRQLLGKPVDYKDVEWVDPEYYNSLCWILENDPTPLDLTFSVEADEFGVNRIVSLKEGGDGISVTQENKREFVQLSAQYRLYSSIKDQIENLSTGFYEIIPKDLIQIFNEQELELLISGTPDIDVDEWRAATEYNGYTSSDPNIVWWWRALKSFNRDERAKVPLGGFTDLQGVQGVQRFSIHRAYGESDRLPQAHTCFNQIDLPQYSSYEMLRQQLLLAIIEGGEGFAFS
ncbi:hypothetical protein FB45DRAFT_975025 [Roridomyces roridus]|uniref:HECT-type E3 ubiquitin transferase n=1 Tax=Roridomyces roridus TaxID=1738132 RepID=A0AAD7CF64_9AGAR|nr:hypothetical protein FB45DRAFT_975025 [Roridomyces roridus]